MQVLDDRTLGRSHWRDMTKNKAVVKSTDTNCYERSKCLKNVMVQQRFMQGVRGGVCVWVG